jgi:hypothetical protein
MTSNILKYQWGMCWGWRRDKGSIYQYIYLIFIDYIFDPKYHFRY